MPLHVTSSTVGRDAPLAQVPTEVENDQSTAGDAATTDAAERPQTDSAAISSQGQRLASLSGQADQLKAIDEAEQLARSLAAKMSANAQAATAAHGTIDPARVAQLLDG